MVTHITAGHVEDAPSEDERMMMALASKATVA